ncbi:MAG: aminotransferase class I/II-fold pyridoxal phosphate-dependent enzyme, partial [Lachnospiraceae bacterium]|nr:aminotransferase class I/II-fold pyridoxal phosphate-dependent enzyme [Lachnospiraceae bacterium]
MQAVILAAGMSKNLDGFLAPGDNKCMVEINGVKLIDRMLHQLDNRNLQRIIMVVGYGKDALKEHIATLAINTPIVFIDNNDYEVTNNIYTLALAKDYLVEDDTLLFQADLIFESSIIDKLLDDKRETLALVDKYEGWMDGACIKIGKNDTIDKFVVRRKFKFNDIKDYYKTVNIYKFSKRFSEKYYVPFLEAFSQAMGYNEYYEEVLHVMTVLDEPHIRVKRLSGERWFEIDNLQDIDIAASMFHESDDEKVRLLQERYGGFWRYPKIKDLNFLVNPYYPPQKLLNEIKANVEKLITSYPSSHKVTSLLAAKNFHVDPENVLVGNGASEIIKCLMNHVLKGKIGITHPVFSEFTNRIEDNQVEVFDTAKNDFHYTADDLMEYFGKTDVKNIIVVNPDNPSGNYIPKADMLRLIDWCDEKDINIVVDESFVDFADEEDASLVNQEALDGKTHLSVVKSISKSHGIPGLRVGIFASDNQEYLEIMRDDLAIWNVNSVAEYFMQICDKYSDDYQKSLVK